MDSLATKYHYLPDGPYLLTVTGIGEEYLSQTNVPVRVVKLTLGHTNRWLTWLVVDSPKVRWAWDSLADSLPELDVLVGRQFIFLVNRENWEGKWRDRVKYPICEYVA